MLKQFTVLILFILVLTTPITASAQAAPSINNVSISIWPAYDRPGVLVIYHISLASTTTLPAELSFRIPKEAGTPYAVAAKDATGQLVNLEYNPVDGGAWTSINLTTTQAELQIEYYDPRLITNGADHRFTYSWAGDYDVATMSIEIQQPYGASNMKISSGNATTRSGGDGLTYFLKDVGHVAANEQFSLDISYTKASTKLSAEDLQIQPTAPLSSTTTLKDILIGYLPWILGALGVLIIAGGSFWYWRSGQQPQTQKSPRKRRRSRSNRAEAEPAPAEGAIYCHQCGKRASSSDRFCRSCGATLRVE